MKGRKEFQTQERKKVQPKVKSIVEQKKDFKRLGEMEMEIKHNMQQIKELICRVLVELL